jgi:perosamine synthetase
MTPSLGSMTLDQDDVDIASAWLHNRERWGEGEIVSRYEFEFGCWNGSKHAFAFMSGREALSACIHALGLQAGDEVILPGYTCIVVPNAFHYAGVKTVYSDIELETYGLDVAQLEAKITVKTRAILVRHLYGLVCRDYEAILDLARCHGLKVIEDCAHSTGAEYKRLKVGNRGDVAFYSSEQSKVFARFKAAWLLPTIAISHRGLECIATRLLSQTNFGLTSSCTT